MQRLLPLKLASNLPKSPSSSSLFHFHKTLSLTKPPQTQTQNHFFSSFPRNPLPHQHKVHGFLSNPLPRKHFSLDTLLRLSDCRRSFLQTQFPKQRFQFIPKQSSHLNARSSWFQTISSNDLIFALILANVAVYLQGGDGRTYIYTSILNFTSGSLHTMITPAIAPANFGDMVFNMIGLCYFGRNIGRVFGPEFLLKLYLAGAIGGSVFYLVHHSFLRLTTPIERRKVDVRIKSGSKCIQMDISVKPGCGASGAVNAVMLLDIFFQPTIPVVLLGIFLIGKDIPRLNEGNIHVSGSTHLGGAAVALIAWTRLRMGLRIF